MRKWSKGGACARVDCLISCLNCIGEDMCRCDLVIYLSLYFQRHLIGNYFILFSLLCNLSLPRRWWSEKKTHHESFECILMRLKQNREEKKLQPKFNVARASQLYTQMKTARAYKLASYKMTERNLHFLCTWSNQRQVAVKINFLFFFLSSFFRMM